MISVSKKIASPISAVVTCSNYGAYLETCLRSLIAQTRPFSQIILVDDASVDGTPDVARRFSGAVRYERVVYDNAPRAREHGVRLASGEFLVVVDADNWLDAEFNRRMAEPLEKDPSCAVSYCGALFAAKDGRLLEDRVFPMVRYSYRLLCRDNFIDQCSMVRRAAWRPQDPSLGALMDWDQWLGMLREGWRAELVRSRLFYYRVHDQGITARYSAPERAVLASRIREKYAPYERTVLLFIERRRPDLGRVLRRIAQDCGSPSTQRLAIDNTADPFVRAQVRQAGWEVYGLPHPLKIPRTILGRERVRREIRHRARLCYFARHFIAGKNLRMAEAGRVDWRETSLAQFENRLRQPDCLHEWLEGSVKCRRRDPVAGEDRGSRGA